ncbi:hypothetical protein B5M09_004756 [Aphanomyces astaci]|uniref:Uncharacterized protein n=1 Tax=Aphanomyces astaci TaxID=112090 RepID=A0A3R7WH97_APHAT|nr:hypothetical protein B5M09_004756 [Aphanomyces astaci]
MDTGMVLAQLRLPDGDAPHVATFLSELRTLAATESATAAIHTTLKGLPAALEKAVYVYEKYPLIIDETGQAAQFFKYQRGCFLMAGNPADVTESVLRRSLVAALRLGTTMTLCLDKLAGLELDQFFSDGWFPSQVLNRHEFSKPEVWAPLLRPVSWPLARDVVGKYNELTGKQGEGDPDASLFLPSDAFKFVVLCGNIPPPPRTLERMCLIRVQSQDTMKDSQDDTAGGGVAAALGLREVSSLMEKKLQERLTSHVEREHVAKLRIRDDLVALASSTASTAAGELKAMLLGLAADAVVNADKPRGRSANSRDERGCTLLALAAQHDNADVATLLLTHWKAPHAKDTYIDVFRAQVNARDMKGWTPVAIAVFHQAKRTTRLLLQHGANPRLKNQVLDDSLHYKPLQFTLLDEWESEQLASTLENNRNKFSVGAAEPLPSDGGATLLAIEVAEEAQQKASSKKKVPGKKTKSKKTK